MEEMVAPLLPFFFFGGSTPEINVNQTNKRNGQGTMKFYIIAKKIRFAFGSLQNNTYLCNITYNPLWVK